VAAGPGIVPRLAQPAHLLDYDGTLVPFAPRPRDAVPTPRVVDLVARLAGAAGVTAAIVSGRARADLDALLRPRARTCG
jgi:trehalose-phosphatase